MYTKEGDQLETRRLNHLDLSAIRELMLDVISRLPSQELFAMDDERYFLDILNGTGEVYGVFRKEELVAFSVLAFPGVSESNLGIEFGIPERERSLVAALDSTVVHESVRGLGLQRYFHELRETRAKESGCLYLYSTVHPQNHASIKNLEAAGFTLQFTRPMYGGKDRHCYMKRLSR
ncbi:GNAT family N-acetyltransferase [Alkalicoccobacillus murimartini]|uniref:GNAT superfamily N-acetyltransferase n=1 Tax=Alkalicoccobacillus murimartini TaxID=171685 RepID=A0ABT9YMH0_9BACI|nr:GNAT family N-acetyltransferase [Alkalicoccobacillus murimartini]MDQ0208680.1 GNAT superfamily N-acetyltransferase [Alkalicoccobacillus murimartini]